MNNQEILEGNKLIAEFIKLPYIGKNIYGFSGDVFDLTVGEVKGNILCYANAESMQFHSSWDWMMPVVNKCLLICHENSLNEWENAFCDKFLTRDIQPLFDLCVEFIKWYNKNKEL